MINPREIARNSIYFRRNSAVSGRNLTISGVSQSMDPSGYSNIWQADTTGTDRILFRYNPRRNPLVRIPVKVSWVPVGFAWVSDKIRSNPISDPTDSDRIYRSDRITWDIQTSVKTHCYESLFSAYLFQHRAKID